MDECGKELARRFAGTGATRILNGGDFRHCPGADDRPLLGTPGGVRPQDKPITMPDTVYLTVAPSHTKGRNVELIVSPEYLKRA